MSSINFTDGSTVVPAAWTNDIDASVYEQTGVGKTTIASATTPDIFAVTVGRLIDYTGTATCTGFVAAVSAGSDRTLYCAGACLFTAGANLLIEGIPSGTTITLAAGAIVKVYAITTTQFKMTYSLSGTFTATGTGFTVNPTTTASYTVENGVVSIRYPYGQFSGTSNATTFSITGAPACLFPSGIASLPISYGSDNTATCLIYGEVATSGVINLFKWVIGSPATSFTGSGGKSASFNVMYHL